MTTSINFHCHGPKCRIMTLRQSQWSFWLKSSKLFNTYNYSSLPPPSLRRPRSCGIILSPSRQQLLFARLGRRGHKRRGDYVTTVGIEEREAVGVVRERNWEGKKRGWGSSRSVKVDRKKKKKRRHRPDRSHSICGERPWSIDFKSLHIKDTERILVLG